MLWIQSVDATVSPMIPMAAEAKRMSENLIQEDLDGGGGWGTKYECILFILKSFWELSLK